MDINFNETKNKIFKDLENERHIVIATSSDDKVTARNISHIIVNDKIYFQTDKNFEKIEQIDKNEQVALCVNNIQIVGTAKVCGHPFDKSNEFFLIKFKNIHTKSFSLYSKMADEVVVEVSPIFVTLWEYEENKPLRIFVDFKKQTVVREYCDNR